ncbi:GerAB/ArcD/ProY family transporter [Priestia aryabhattai]|uniref:GerAB/ArcD/ProY family transporter n=1 Tax=Priestia aryabhattai TaxID=412384 RepID=UPI0029C9DC06|nr:GerAB/ArcD/ProY family transporter [Priestia aryabhattai]
MLILLNEINISAAQFRKLVTLYSIGSTIIVVPAAITADAHQDAWIAALFGVASSIGLVFLFTSLGNMFPALTLMEMNEKILGKLFGKIVSAVFVLSNLFISSQVLYYVGNFLQGIEVVIAILWFITLFFKLCIYFYATLLGFANVFHIKDYKLFSFPVALIMITLSLIVYPSVSYQKEWDTKTWIPYSLLVGILYPLFLLIAGFIQNKKRRSSNG